jgi:DNA-directed RNA polymerase specialized sigma24 family protein
LRAALVAMVRKRVPDSEVEDIVQSTLADALESPHAPQDAESLRRWIFGVAKNKVVDYHRRAGRETFELPEVPGKPAPHVEADLLRWAEKHLPPGEENKTTLDWMLREGEGEKLESIAQTERVPAPRVRQRVSRLRRHLKSHWQKEVTLLATLGVLITIALLFVRNRDPEPIANDDVPRGIEIRKQGLEKCAAGEWKDCLDKLDAAKRLDPAGDAQPAVNAARESANKALSAPPPASAPTPSTNITPPPAPSSMLDIIDSKSMEASKLRKTAPWPSATPLPTTVPKMMKPSGPVRGGSSDSSDFDSLSSPMSPGTGMPLGSGAKDAPPPPPAKKAGTKSKLNSKADSSK